MYTTHRTGPANSIMLLHHIIYLYATIIILLLPTCNIIQTPIMTCYDVQVKINPAASLVYSNYQRNV